MRKAASQDPPVWLGSVRENHARRTAGSIPPAGTTSTVGRLPAEFGAGPNTAESELIPGWYSTTGSVTYPSTVKHVFNEDYIPPSWQASGALPGGTIDFDVTVCGGQMADSNELRW